MAKEKPIPKMCKGCARNKRTHCEVIKDPEYIYENRGGICYAWVNPQRAVEIEEEIKGRRKAV